MEKSSDRNTTAEKWQGLIKQYEASGKRYATEWCRESGVSYDSFIFWRRHFEKSAAKASVSQSSFVELVDKPSSSGIEIYHRGLTLSLKRDFDPGTLIRCLQVLEKI